MIFIFSYFYDIFMIFLLSLLPFERFIGHGEHITHDIAFITFLINRLTLFVTVKPLLVRGSFPPTY